jgi:hypothetical protein
MDGCWNGGNWQICFLSSLCCVCENTKFEFEFEFLVSEMEKIASHSWMDGLKGRKGKERINK